MTTVFDAGMVIGFFSIQYKELRTEAAVVDSPLCGTRIIRHPPDGRCDPVDRAPELFAPAALTRYAAVMVASACASLPGLIGLLK